MRELLDKKNKSAKPNFIEKSWNILFYF
jgi:hypothetical protein